MRLRPLLATQTKRTFTQIRGSSRSTAPRVRRRLNHGQPSYGGHLRLAGLDDGAVHAVCDLVREPDVDLLEARSLETCDVLASRERAGDATDIRPALRPLFRRELVLR